MNIENNKTDHVIAHSNTIAGWLAKAEYLQKLPPADSLLVFSCLYSALNGLSWFYSSQSGDKAMIMDFVGKLWSYHVQQRTGQEIIELVTHAEDAISECKQRFNDVHKLQSRTNIHAAGSVVKFSTHATPAKYLSDIVLAQETNRSKYIICMELVYQFRCNLVHGSKNIHAQDNELVAKVFSKIILLIMGLTPDEAISPQSKIIAGSILRSIR